jgi:NADPH:quinone reductase-like Zn-dependent oxidoreductase
MAGNQAAWLDGKGQTLRIASAEYPKAGSDEIVVKNAAIAINPVDCKWTVASSSCQLAHRCAGKVQDSGYFIKDWPTILGCDVAGEVVEVGSDVKRLKKGDRVAGYVWFCC